MICSFNLMQGKKGKYKKMMKSLLCNSKTTNLRNEDSSGRTGPTWPVTLEVGTVKGRVLVSGEPPWGGELQP